MKLITLPDERRRRLTFYLAMEEYVARETDEDEAFFLWQTDPTVIFGRNQLMEAEVNVPYCQKHGIRLVRRKSGGGCVYSDPGNLMLSYITKGENVGFYFDRYLRRIALILQRIGVDAQVSGRNDILIGDRKVSGNAFYRIPGRSIIHGTLLFDTDFDRMQQAITPSESKLRSKGVESVRRHVTNLKEHISLPIEDFKQHLIREMCRDERRELQPEEVSRIEQIEQTYFEEDFFAGKNPAYTVRKQGRIEGAGELTAEMELKHGKIRRLHLTGDFFMLGEAETELNRLFQGVPCKRPELETALRGFDLRPLIRNLTTEDFIKLIIKP